MFIVIPFSVSEWVLLLNRALAGWRSAAAAAAASSSAPVQAEMSEAFGGGAFAAYLRYVFNEISFHGF